MTEQAEGEADYRMAVGPTALDAPAEALVSDRTKRALLANLRHELRTPINAIIGYGEILIEEAEGLGQHLLLPDLQRIRSAGQRLLALLDELLDPSRIEAAKTDLASEAFATYVRHELRTPLNAVIGYTEMLLESAEEDGSSLLPDLHKVHAAGRRLLDLLDHIIRLSTIEAGRGELDLEAVGELASARDVVTTIRALADDTAHNAYLESASLLVVDDNDMNRDMLRRQLERQGYDVAVAADGRQALDMMARLAVDLVLLDMVMPEMNGYDVLRTLKADPAVRHIPVIMISALDDTDSVVRCIEVGADDYLPKPFNPVLLKARVGACLEKKRLRDREQAYLEQLRLERERSERLLLNVLPAPIADRLKQGEGPIADSFEEVTVLFADLVGFTRRAAALPAKALVVLLNDIFSAFDELADLHGLEKIKTIGDAYMAVSGLPVARPDHAEAAIDMALAMLAAMGRIRSESCEPFQLRVGVHSGPVAAGVIGTKKFAYDLWGDTVNTASRMESHGVPDRIAVTEAVYQRLRDKYRFQERGVVHVKDKGAMRIYLVTQKL